MKRAVTFLGVLILAGVVYEESRKPEEERNWHGKVFGMVPYDFRVPTWERIKEAYWNPASDRIFTDRVFGVGWSVNLPVLAARVRQLLGQLEEEE